MTVGYRVRCHHTGCEGEILSIGSYKLNDYDKKKQVEYLVSWDHGLLYGVKPENVDMIPQYRVIQTTADTRDLKRPIFERPD